MVDTDKSQKTVHTPLVTQRRKQAWITMLLGASILLCGMGVGFGSAMVYLGGPTTKTLTEHPKPPQAAEAISRRLIAKCGLDEEQTVKVKEILLKRLGALRDIRTKAMEEMVLVHAEIKEDLADVLTPEQLEKWNSLSAEARKHSRFRHHSKRQGSGRSDRGDRGKPNGRNGGMLEVFKRLDKDNNGELTKEETEKARMQLKPLLEKADTNGDGDGKISREEFETQLRRHHRDRSRGRGRERENPDRPEGDLPPRPPATDL
ncbi:MAG: hypothetical protein GY794_23030 [bacterium]|nr:hypothetical protein [bacterium]